ncbi:MAG: hypothetical protein GJ676_18415 [Rhodobacteraceae bacterium]|nr:hypothetical protein [Paracoccaceae bacterium]
MVSKLLLRLVLVLAAVIAIYFGTAWYHSLKLGPGEEPDDWIASTLVDPKSLAVAGAANVTLILENPQGLEKGDYDRFLHADQGSLLLPEDIFRGLEALEDGELFFATENLRQWRYLAPGKSAPNSLPIGFALTTNPWKGEHFVGLTCTACHSGFLTYKGTGLYVVGAPTQADFQSMTEALAQALTETLKDAERFDRFAVRLGADNQTKRQDLRNRLQREEELMRHRVQINASELRYGFGRVDAVGQIYNMATADNLNLPQNLHPPEAPVSYPHIWGTGQADVAQWTGFAPNSIPGAVLLRNVGEVIGVFGRVDVLDGKTAYPSSVNVVELGDLEAWVNRIEPPAWPEAVFGPIDQDLAAMGKGLYARHCEGCHVLATPYEAYKATLVSPDELGVDPLAARNTVSKGVSPSGKTELKLKLLIQQTFHVIAEHPIEAVEAILQGKVLDKFGKRGGYTYKARTLNGIWATAPYLHNGSVPSLYHLLSPPEERPSTWRYGGWEFDPKHVGLEEFDGPDGFVLDTSKPGNRNTGHDSRIFGKVFTEDERWALIEYLKTL